MNSLVLHGLPDHGGPFPEHRTVCDKLPCGCMHRGRIGGQAPIWIQRPVIGSAVGDPTGTAANSSSWAISRAADTT